MDSIVIPNVSPAVFPAITGATMPDRIQALGIMESFSLATMIIAAVSGLLVGCLAVILISRLQKSSRLREAQLEAAALLEEAKERAETVYSWDAIAHRTYGVYLKALEAKAGHMNVVNMNKVAVK